MNPDSVRIVLYIRASVAEVWRALTDPDLTQQFFFGTRIESEWKTGDGVRLLFANGVVAARGVVLVVNEPSRLAYSWSVDWSPRTTAEPPSRVAFELARNGENCRLTLTHDEFTAGSAVLPAVSLAWPGVLSSLKTLLETGTPLTIVDDRSDVDKRA